MALSASEVDMELKASNLDQSLQRIFEELANSSFVALDLEFSGISTKQSSQQKRAPSDKGTHKQSLQQRYEEVRDAANKYQVLQIGMTVVTENRFPGGSEPTTYDLRPYNMYLSPLIRERIDLERDFAFQSEAISFLMGEGFSMDGPFRDGVNYLSRSEENVARENEERKANKDNIADINLKSHEVGLLQFVADTRHKIRAWDSKQVLELTKRHTAHG
jgi:poly(A)-specific ribonuclease